MINNSIKERAIKIPKYIKDFVSTQNACLKALFILDLHDLVSEKEDKAILKRIKKMKPKKQIK